MLTSLKGIGGNSRLAPAVGGWQQAHKVEELNSVTEIMEFIFVLG